MSAAHLIGVDHIQLAIPPGGEADARRFWVETLGLAETPKPADLAARGGCWFEGPGVRLHMGVETDFHPARKAHPGLLAADAAHLRARLEAAGYVTRDDAPLDGYLRFYADDPFGNRIEFLQRL